jgi:hypothetical protein
MSFTVDADAEDRVSEPALPQLSFHEPVCRHHAARIAPTMNATHAKQMK